MSKENSNFLIRKLKGLIKLNKHECNERVKSHLTTKMMLPSLIVMMIGFLIVSTAGYIRLRNNVNALGSQYSLTLARLASTVIDSTYTMSTSRNSDPGSPLRLKLQDQVNELMEHPEYIGVYVLAKDKKTGEVYSIYDTEDPSIVGETWEYDLDLVEQAFEGEVVGHDTMETYGDDVLISAYSPIYDKTGKVVNVVGIDFDANEVDWKLWKARVERTGMLIVYPLLVGLTMSLIMFNMILRIKRLNRKIWEVGSESSDLTKLLDAKHKDELSAVTHNFNTVLTKMNGIICDVSDATKTISTNAKDIDDCCSTISLNVESSSSNAEEINATMEVLIDTTNHVSQAFKDAQGISDAITKSSTDKVSAIEGMVERISEVYDSSINDMESATQYAEDISTRVLGRIEDSKAVNEIQNLTKAVLDIASQTRLLSLNASIEAARAGEAGRGFSVVATEIGKLAEQSAEAASAIQDISQAVIKAVNALNTETETLIEFNKEVTNTGYSKLTNLAGEYRDTVTDLKSDLSDFAKSSITLSEQMDEVCESLEITVCTVDECKNAVSEITTTLEETLGITETVDNIAKLNVSTVKQFESFLSTFKYGRTEQTETSQPTKEKTKKKKLFKI